MEKTVLEFILKINEIYLRYLISIQIIVNNQKFNRSQI